RPYWQLSSPIGALRRLSFFFQAEDGIRDGHVTGVQTCALPISQHGTALPLHQGTRFPDRRPDSELAGGAQGNLQDRIGIDPAARSEERRVGKECRSRWSRYQEKKKESEQFI